MNCLLLRFHNIADVIQDQQCKQVGIEHCHKVRHLAKGFDKPFSHIIKIFSKKSYSLIKGQFMSTAYDEIYT